jgi:hypothetical protein
VFGDDVPRAIDLANSAVPQFVMIGEAASDAAGRSVDWIGDFNGDGFDDLVVGAYRVDGSSGGDVGAAYVVFGGPGLFRTTIDLGDLDGSDGFRFLGRSGTDTAGERVTGIGDINADGRPDLAVAAYRADPPGSSGAGEVYVLYGTNAAMPASLGPDDLDGSNGFELHGESSFDQLGRDVTGAGDVNGDGIDDFIVGADGFENEGAAYVIFGRPEPKGPDTAFPAALGVAGLNGTTGFRLTGGGSGDETGRSVAGAGDVDGDGIDDLLVGAPGASPGGRSEAGSVFVVFGSDQGFGAEIDLGSLDGSNGYRVDGLSAGDELGHAVSAAGDVDGDGRADWLTSSLQHDEPGLPNSGITYLVFGSAVDGNPSFDLAAIDGSNGSVLRGAWPDGNLGRALGAAGDFNRDGRPDWLAAADRANPEGRVNAGEIAIVYGADSVPAERTVDELDGHDGVVVAGPLGGDRAGFDLAGGGDLDGDGFPDLVIGAPFASPGGLTGRGQAIVLSGRGLEPVFSDRFEAPAP